MAGLAPRCRACWTRQPGSGIYGSPSAMAPIWLAIEVCEDGENPAVVVVRQREVELGEDAGAVLAHGFLRDEQPLCDGAVGPALRHQFKNLALPAREPGQRFLPRLAAEQLGHDFRVHDGATGRD